MSKLTTAIRDELAAFFGAVFATGLAAQTYEPRGGDRYTPMTDTRLVRLVVAGRQHGKSEWARVKRIVDDLPPATVEVLRLACISANEVACRPPAALAAGRRFAEAMVHEQDLSNLYAYERQLGTTGILLATRIIEAAARPRHIARVDEYTLRDATRRALELELVNVDNEAETLIGQAVDAYLDARSRLQASKRSHKARMQRENEALLDAELGKKKRKERVRLEQRHERLRRAS